MSNPVKAILLYLAFAFFCNAHRLYAQNNVLWYRYPSSYWNSQALHLGNGFMGASFFGGIDEERFALTEQSIWSGGPFRGNWTEMGLNPKAKTSLREIREAIVTGELALADSLTQNEYLGKTTRFGSFSTIGDLLIKMENQGKQVNGYTRKLDLNESIGLVNYQIGNVHYTREYFCSYPDRVLVLKFKSNQAGAINCHVSMEMKQKEFQVQVTKDSYSITGVVDNGELRFRVGIKTILFGGSSVAGKDVLHIRQADSVLFLIQVTTNYRLHYPDYKGPEPGPLSDSLLESASKTGYSLLKQRHIEDYQKLYSRVHLQLKGEPYPDSLPTNERWERMKKGKSDLGLKELAFNLGRYLIISSSRPGTLPANLQGKWNTFQRAPWSGNYQANINIQEIYWSCGPANLPECGIPYIDWTRDLVNAGREVANRVYGTDGWISHTTGNIWGHALPEGGLSYGVYPVAPVWHCQYLWDHFLFTQDTVFLSTIAYPIIKEACRFWLKNMVDFEGYKIIAPSVSAEHGALLDEKLVPGKFSSDSYGKVRYTLPAPAQDREMLWDLFSMCMKSASILNLDAELCQELKTLGEKFPPLKIGRLGQLQEWLEDIDDPNDHHRHISHLYALCPANDIHPLTTPALAEAAKVSLNLRGEGRFKEAEASGGNWSLCCRIWCWARLMDGDRANKIFTDLLTNEAFENLLSYQHISYHWNRPDLYKESDSLFLHFQLDATASTPGFMAEMLLQSQLNEIILLPALPTEWKSGSVKGLRARGGYTIDMEWKEGQLLKALIRSQTGSIPKIRVGNEKTDPRKDKRIKLLLKVI